MINRAELKNFGPIKELDWQNLGGINLIIGNNDCGKSFLLKGLYSAVRTLEDYKRGDNQDSAAEILAKKLYWTFQTEKIGDLVNKQANNNSLSFKFEINNCHFSYGFGKDTTKDIKHLENHVSPLLDKSIFLPTKEVLSLYYVILQSREFDFQFGFDDTYLDLARALRISPKQGKNSKEFAQARKQLAKMIDGKIEFDTNSQRWQFKKGNQKFAIGVTAEGIKKIGILDTLLGNRYFTDSSIIFIDEIESALHPNAISMLLDIVAILARRGIQFFIASHSYFVIKKLFLIAQEQQISIPVLSKEGDSWQQSDLLNGMPDNAIINESIRLYEEEVDLAFK